MAFIGSYLLSGRGWKLLTMALYSYKCTICGNEEEHLVSIVKQDHPTECEKCQGLLKKNEVNVTSFNLKGSGWYQPGAPKKG